MKLILKHSCNHNDGFSDHVTFRSSKLPVFSVSNPLPLSVADVHDRRTRVKGETAQYNASKGYEIEEVCRTCAVVAHLPHGSQPFG
jgi:hypothetical protein